MRVAPIHIMYLRGLVLFPLFLLDAARRSVHASDHDYGAQRHTDTQTEAVEVSAPRRDELLLAGFGTAFSRLWVPQAVAFRAGHLRPHSTDLPFRLRPRRATVAFHTARRPEEKTKMEREKEKEMDKQTAKAKEKEKDKAEEKEKNKDKEKEKDEENKFTQVLDAVLRRKDAVGFRAAVEESLAHMDEDFFLQLGARIAAADDDALPALWGVMSAVDEIYLSRSSAAADDAGGVHVAVDHVLATHWARSDTIIGDEEEQYINMYGRLDGSMPLDVTEKASVYGEVTPSGARQLFQAMGLANEKAAGAVFYDLGSGAGRLVAQAWLELPDARAVGIELAPTRHAAAVRSWRSVVAESPELWQLGRSPLLQEEGGPEFRLGSMLETDLGDATHVYVSSVCFGKELMEALWSRLATSAPALKTVATLKRFPAPAVEAKLSHTARVEMTWSRAGGPGQEVFVYRL